jgi:hypothetical protein
MEPAWERPELWRLTAESSTWEAPRDDELLMTNAGPVKVVEVCRVDALSAGMLRTVLIVARSGVPLG